MEEIKSRRSEKLYYDDYASTSPRSADAEAKSRRNTNILNVAFFFFFK